MSSHGSLKQTNFYPKHFSIQKENLLQLPPKNQFFKQKNCYTDLKKPPIFHLKKNFLYLPKNNQFSKWKRNLIFAWKKVIIFVEKIFLIFSRKSNFPKKKVSYTCLKNLFFRMKKMSHDKTALTKKLPILDMFYPVRNTIYSEAFFSSCNIFFYTQPVFVVHI